MFPSKPQASTMSRGRREPSPAESIAESLASFGLAEQFPEQAGVTSFLKVSLPLEYGPPHSWTQAEKDFNTEIQDLKQRMLREKAPDMGRYLTAITAVVDKYYPSGDSQSLQKDSRFQSTFGLSAGNTNASAPKRSRPRVKSSTATTFINNSQGGRGGKHDKVDYIVIDDSGDEGHVVDSKRRKIFSNQSMNHEADSRQFLNTDHSDAHFGKTPHTLPHPNHAKSTQKTGGEDEADAPNEPKGFTDDQKSLARRYVYVLRSTIYDNNTLLLNGSQPKGVSPAKANYPLDYPQGKQIADLCKVITDDQDKCFRAMKLSTQIQNDLTQFLTKYEEKKKDKAETRWLEKWEHKYTDALANKIEASNWFPDPGNFKKDAANGPKSSFSSNTSLEPSSNQAVTKRALLRKPQRLATVLEHVDSAAPESADPEAHLKPKPFSFQDDTNRPAPWAVPDPHRRTDEATEVTLWLYLETIQGRTGLPKQMNFFPGETWRDFTERATRLFPYQDIRSFTFHPHPLHRIPRSNLVEVGYLGGEDWEVVRSDMIALLQGPVSASLEVDCFVRS